MDLNGLEWTCVDKQLPPKYVNFKKRQGSHRLSEPRGGTPVGLCCAYLHGEEKCETRGMPPRRFYAPYRERGQRQSVERGFSHWWAHCRELLFRCLSIQSRFRGRMVLAAAFSIVLLPWRGRNATGVAGHRRQWRLHQIAADHGLRRHEAPTWRTPAKLIFSALPTAENLAA